MSDRNARSSVSPETPQPTGSEDSGIASLVVIAQLSGVAVSAERLRHLSGLSRPIDALTLVRLARQVGLKARSTTSQTSRLAQTPLPAIANSRWTLPGRGQVRKRQRIAARRSATAHFSTQPDRT